jgi:hypothetical protein
MACALLGRRTMNLGRSIVSGAIVALLFALSIETASGAAGDYDRRDDLTEAVISCEEAYTRLESCCPGYGASADGDHGTSPCLDHEWRKTYEGCYSGGSSVDTGNIEPLALRESRCIREMSCEDLVATGVCDRAKRDATRNDSDNRPATRGLCP